MPPRRKVAVADPGRPLPAGPKKTTGGNSVCDQEWIAAMLEDGSLHQADASLRPMGFLYDVLYQWDESVDDVNPDFFEFYRPRKSRETPRQCSGTAYIRDQRGGYVVDNEWNRLVRTCLARPGKGTNVCHAHGSLIPAVKAAAQRALAEAAEVVALRLVGLTAPRDEHDAEIAHKDRISAMNSVLDRAGVKGNVEIEVTTPGFKRVLERMFSDDSAEDDDE